jgi:hypothetical protein
MHLICQSCTGQIDVALQRPRRCADVKNRNAPLKLRSMVFWLQDRHDIESIADDVQAARLQQLRRIGIVVHVPVETHAENMSLQLGIQRPG